MSPSVRAGAARQAGACSRNTGCRAGDGLHWAFARCVQMPDDASLVRWKKQKAQYLERQRLKAERQAAEAEAARHIF